MNMISILIRDKRQEKETIDSFTEINKNNKKNSKQLRFVHIFLNWREIDIDNESNIKSVREIVDSYIKLLFKKSL